MLRCSSCHSNVQSVHFAFFELTLSLHRSLHPFVLEILELSCVLSAFKLPLFQDSQIIDGEGPEDRLYWLHFLLGLRQDWHFCLFGNE